MSEWRNVTLGEVCELKRGYDLPRGSRGAGSVPVISSSGPTGWHDEAKVEAPGVVTGRYGTLGQVFYVTEDFWPLNTSLYVRDFKGNDPRFVAALLRSLDLAQYDGAAAVPGLNRNHLHTLLVRVPELPVQSTIAHVAQAFDGLIESNRRRVDALEEMARAIYREWFVRFRYPGHENVPLVDSTLGPIPEGWKAQPLATIARVNRSSRKPAADEVFKYLDISALSEREIGEMGAVSGMDAPGRARRVISPGDTVWATVRPNRRAHALVFAPGDDWIASTGMAVLTPTAISSAFLFETTSTTAFSDWLVGRATGAAYPAVRANDFEEALVVVPGRAVDAAFAEKVAPMHELSWKLRAVCSALVGLRDLLLPKLVTGQIDVSSLDLDALFEDRGA